MQVGILGPLAVSRDGVGVDVGGVRLRALLARLALDAGQPVTVFGLVDAVWGEEPPAEPANALQTLVSRLRRCLGGAETVRQVHGSYHLAVHRDDVDAHRFERLAREGRAVVRDGDPARGADLLRAALALWRGPVLADLADRPFAAAAAVRLDDLRRAAVADRVDADLALGRGREVVAELEVLVGEHPLDERFVRQLMAALYAADRQADALLVYERLRSRLAGELGSDPSPQTRAAHLALLRGDPPLAVPATPTQPATARRGNLRAPLSSFVGRDEEVTLVTTLLREHRLVTLIGPGGAGKTRLVGEAAAGWVDRVPDGVWFVELAPVTDPVHVPQAILGALGVRESHLIDRRGAAPPRDPVARLVDALAGSRAVLVLDNCEHLVGAVAEVAETLLARCPDLRIVTTSREPLGIFGENLVAVPPLGLPSADATAVEALAHPAVQLFADRAAAACPGFAVDDGTVTAVVEICRRLDGLPLAIELAAARLRSLPVGHVAARLDDRFRLLTGGSRTAVPRHRTLRAVVEWSWDLLTGPERRLAERLAVFPAGVTPASAETVCAGADLPAGDVFDLLAALVDKSLLQMVDPTGPRYRMLETIREFGVDRLRERGELERVRAAHARYFARLAHHAEPHLRQADQLEWMARLDAEQDNILAALRYLVDSGDGGAALSLALDLVWYWTLTNSHAEAATWLRVALDAPGPADSEVRLVGEAIWLLTGLTADEEAAGTSDRLRELSGLADRVFGLDLTGRPLLALLKPMVAVFTGRVGEVDRLVDDALGCPDPWVRAAVLLLRANMAENDGDTERMRADVTAATVQFRRIGDRWGLAACLTEHGLLASRDGDLDGAIEAYQEALLLLRELAAGSGQTMLRLRLADLRARRGDLDGAAAELDRAEEFGAGSGVASFDVFVYVTRAHLARLGGDLDGARRLHAEAARRLDRLGEVHPIHGHGHALVQAAAAILDLATVGPDTARPRLVSAYRTAVATKDMPVLGSVGVAVADLAAHTNRPELAAEVLGAAAALSGSDDPTNLDIRRISVGLRERLGDDGFAAAYARGRSLPRDAAVARLDPAAPVVAPPLAQARLR